MKRALLLGSALGTLVFAATGSTACNSGSVDVDLSTSSGGGNGGSGGSVSTSGNGGSGGSMDDGLTVETDLGETRGVVRNGVKEWRGLPYAVPPLKELRWAMTKPATPWEGVLDATDFGAACAQEARENLTEASLNEDCLTLNVSVPADLAPGEKLPVLFWIHGGAFIGGSSNLYRLDRLASKGRIVVVSVNYRLGVFGFMPHPVLETDGSSGNLGLADQREAMRWVQRNIAAFGGDPTKVTIAGESAGGGSVCAHLAAPELVEGLFDQAIAQSAACFAQLNTPTAARGAADSVIEAVGCKKADDAETLACLQAADVKELLKAEGAFVASQPDNLIPFAPTPGDASSPNAIYPRSFLQSVAQNKVAKVPMLYGGTRHEMRLYVGYFWQGAQLGKSPLIDSETLATEWLPLFYPGMAPGGGTYAEKILAEYTPAGGFVKDTDAPETLGVLLSDFALKFPINTCLYHFTADRIAAVPNAKPIYFFEFADEAAPVLGVAIAKPYPNFALGSVHSSELNYLFPNLDNTSKIAAPDLGMTSQELADQMIAYWSTFVKTGEPKVNDLPAWPNYTGPASVLRLEPGNIAVYDAEAQHRCAFWKGLYPELLTSPL
ncbi:MAG: carboxylesterase family protein [Deltaproteobacteria bacterium]|nr:carboxylesterase family protein [Deltaproteobacteria bacterium]